MGLHWPVYVLYITSGETLDSKGVEVLREGEVQWRGGSKEEGRDRLEGEQQVGGAVLISVYGILLASLC